MSEAFDETRSDQFSIEFHGPAVDDGRIEVNSFAPSLLAVQVIMDAAAQQLYGPRTQTRVKVAGTNQGSFGGLLEIVVTFLTSDPVLATNTLIGLLIGVREGKRSLSGLIGLAKASKGETPSASTAAEDGVVRIKLGGETYETTEAALRLFRRKDIRDALDALISIRDGTTGIHRFTITSHHGHETVDREDVVVELSPLDEHVAYGLAAVELNVRPHELRELAIVEAEYEIVTVAFDPGSNWRLRNEDGTISARMDDQDFISRMAHRTESFSQGDRILCLMRIIERPWGRTTRKIRVIEKVIKHFPSSASNS